MAKLKFRDPDDNSRWIELEADDAIIDIKTDPTENISGLRTGLLYRYENKLYYWNGEKIIELASNKVEVINNVLNEAEKELIDNNSFVIINIDNDIDNSAIIDPLLYIDSTLSETSKNPVQNWVIKKALEDKQDVLEFTDEVAGNIDRNLIPNVGAVNDALNTFMKMVEDDYAKKSDTYTKTEIDNKIASISTSGGYSKDIINSIGTTTSINDITSTLTLKQGYYNKGTGEYVNGGGKTCTELLPVTAGEKYIVTGNYGYDFCFIAEFNAEKSFKRGVYQDKNGNAGIIKINEEEYIVPVGVSYIAFSYRSSLSSDILIIKKETTTLNNVNEQIGAIAGQLEQVSDELLDAHTAYDGTVYSSTGEAVREQIKQVKTLCNKPTTNNIINPLVVDMLADFNWSCNKEVAAFSAKDAFIDEVSSTPNNAFFCVSGTAGNDYVTVISGGNATINNISTITSDKPFGAVLKYDDGTYVVCNAWYRDETTISIYPKLKTNIVAGELGNLKTGIHLSRRGYEAYAQKIYNTNPKWCEKGSLIVGYRPTQGATEETTPFTLYGATGDTIHKLAKNNYLNAKRFLYQLLPTVYYFYGAGIETETESGIEWTVDLDNKKGYMELFIGGSNANHYDYEEGNPVYIDLYLDGVLHQQVVKTTKILERVCVDFADAKNALLKIYMKKWNSAEYGFSISAISFWENKMHFVDTNYLVPKFSTIGQMFDSWGEFHDYQSAKSLKALHNSRCGITVPYENHSKGSQTTVWGKAWFYENVFKYHPSHMLTDFFINDFNSQGGGLGEATIFGPDNMEYINVVSVDEYIQNVQDLIDMAIVNKIQPIFVGTALYNGYKFNGVDTENRYMTVWYMRLIEKLKGQWQ